jgi:hypothetical protein
MVAWFGARISAGVSEWAEAYQRRKIDDHWAYMPMEEYRITAERIDQLLRFLPLFDVPGKAFTKEWTETELKPGGWLIPPYPEYTDEVIEFFRLAGQPCWCDYSYETQEAENMLQEGDVVNQASLDAIKTMLTYCVRGERFCDGHWESMLQSGRIVSLLSRLKQLRASVV